MPDVRHMDPAMDPNRRRLIGRTVIEHVDLFCQHANRQAIRRLEDAFREALIDYGSSMLFTQNETTPALERVKELIDRAHIITHNKPWAEKLTFPSEGVRLQAVSKCRQHKHQIKTFVDQRTLQTYYYCKRCRKEFWLE
jgi:hypothetical protein